MIRAGVLRNRINVQAKTVAYDSFHQPIETWTTAKTVWAEAITGGGGEFYAAQKVTADTQVVFRVRYDPLLRPTDRVQWSGRIFQVLNVNDVGLNHVEMLISCKEVV